MRNGNMDLQNYTMFKQKSLLHVVVYAINAKCFDVSLQYRQRMINGMWLLTLIVFKTIDYHYCK